jgi:hypothetical protein
MSIFIASDHYQNFLAGLPACLCEPALVPSAKCMPDLVE